MTDEWKPGDRVQLTGTVVAAGYSDNGAVVRFDGALAEIVHPIGPTVLHAGKRLPRQFMVGDEVEWASSPRLYTIVALDGNAAAIVSHDDHPFREWAYLSDLRPAPVKP